MKKKHLLSRDEINRNLEKYNMNKYELYMRLEISEPTFLKYIRNGFPAVYKNELIRLGLVAGELKVRNLAGDMVALSINDDSVEWHG